MRGKANEKPIQNRTEESLGSANGLSIFRFGFSKKRSLVDAIKMITNIAVEAMEGKRWMEGNKKYCFVILLDIKNPFKSA